MVESSRPRHDSDLGSFSRKAALPQIEKSLKIAHRYRAFPEGLLTLCGCPLNAGRPHSVNRPWLETPQGTGRDAAAFVTQSSVL